MWSSETTKLDARTAKTVVQWDGASVSARAAYELCVSSESFRAALLVHLAGAPFSAYFWETPAITKDTAERPFEYVITEAAALASALPEVNAFAEHFGKDSDDDNVVTFENLGRDAMLVVPCPIVAHASYAHLAAFVRGAPASQGHALLTALGQAVLGRLSSRPMWVSTAGMGVYWLHVRLDSRPKYYRHSPYKHA